MHRTPPFMIRGALCAPALALLLSVLPHGAQAQWVWKDQRGQVHASDLPPPRDIPDKNVMQRPSAATPPARATAPAPAAAGGSAVPFSPGASAARTDPELEARKRRADEEQAAQKKAEEARQASVRIENCNRARDALRQLESGMRIARVNDKGEREILDDQTRSAETARARQLAASECR